MGRKKLPIITEWCPFCQSEVKIKGSMRWHKCPVCGNYIKPCAMCDCDKVNCDIDCPLKNEQKPVDKIGEHSIQELVNNGDYLSLVFDWESDMSSADGESFKIVVSYTPDEGAFHFYEARYDLNMNLIDYFEGRDHLTDLEARQTMRRVSRIAKNLGLC